MAAKHGLSEHLRSLSEPDLIDLLRLRPAATMPPQPRSLAELADRLSVPYSVAEALRSLDLGAFRLLEAVCALGADTGRDRLHELLGGPTALDDSRLDAGLEQLRRHALVWEHGGRLRVAGQVRAVLPNPLGLGRPATELLGPLSVEQLKSIGARLGLTKLARKAIWVAEIAAAMGDAEAVLRRLAAATPEIQDAVAELAWDGPRIEGVFLPGPYHRVPAGYPGVELALQGWAIPEPWGQVGEMPREVALAVRGTKAVPTLPEHPEVPQGAPLDPDRLLAAGQAAASATLDGVGRLLTLLGNQPLASLQSGGIGVRELRRVAKQLRARESQVRLWLECAVLAELVWFADDELLPTEAADGWLGAEPAPALAALALAWWRLPITPTHRMDDNGKALPAVGGPVAGPDAPALRARLFEALAAFPPGTPATALDPLIDLLAWRRPLEFGDGEASGPYVIAGLSEARELGLVADQALTPLGRALHDHLPESRPGPDQLAGALAGLLPEPARTATFLPDLTAVVAGAPATELSALLDACADNEARDAASTWRFGPASVRRAFDAGWTAGKLLGELAAVTGKPLPQPLTYLVGDVARRHGQLRVRPAASCVWVDDPALATEVARHRALTGLSLTPLSDTVLSSAKSVADTLAALRAAGYAPAKQDAGGRAVIERATSRRARAPRRGAFARPKPDRRTDPVALARRLRGTASGPESEPPFAPEPEPALFPTLEFDDDPTSARS